MATQEEENKAVDLFIEIGDLHDQAGVKQIELTRILGNMNDDQFRYYVGRCKDAMAIRVRRSV